MFRYCWITILFSLNVACLDAAVIRVREQVTVDQTLIQLQDVIEFSNTGGTRLPDSLLQLTLGPAPAPGKSVRITLDQIRRELTLRGLDQTQLQFAGSSEVLVNRPGHIKPQAISRRKPSSALISHVESTIAQFLQQKLTQPQSLMVQLIPQSLDVLPAEISSRQPLMISGGTAPWTGKQRVQLQRQAEDGQSVSIELDCEVTTRPQLLALRHGLARGQVIRSADLIWVDLPERSHVTGLTDPEEVIGTETTRSIRALVPIQHDDIQALPLVRRNDVVSVTAQVGAISVMRYCKSLDEGALGQLITLVPVDGQERITARVSGYREAIITIADQSAVPSAQQIPDHSRNISSQIPQVQTRQVNSRQTSAGLQVQRVQHRQPEPHSSQQSFTTTAPTTTVKPVSKSIAVDIQANRPAQLP